MKATDLVTDALDNAEVKATAIKVAGGALVYGYTLNEWVAILTIVYLALQIVLRLVEHYQLQKSLPKSRRKGAHGR